MIPYEYDNIAYASVKDLLITDGTVTVSGTHYSVAGATVTITNDIIECESFELKQSLCSNTQIQFGSCESGSVTFTIHENIPSTKGKTLKVYLIPDSDASKMLQLGVFKVAEDKLSADRTKRTITAYDAMYDILNSDVAAWYLSEFPTDSTTKTLATLRADFLTHFGITAESTTLANDSITISRTIEPETLSGADVIKAICEINGVFGQITNEGKFRYVELSPDLDAGLFPSETLYPADDLYPEDVNHSVDVIHHAQYIDVTFEDYMSEAITRLTVRNDDKDAGVTVGTAGNTYVITGNFLVYGYNSTQLTSVATAILNKIKNRYYKPCTVNAIGNPLHEVGDGIRIRTTYRGIVSYILERRLTGIQALRDTYSANGERLCDEQLNTMSSQLNTRVKKDTIVSDLNSKMHGIEITPNSIHVSSTGTFTVDATNFTLDEDGLVTMSGASVSGGSISMSSSGIDLLISSGNIKQTFYNGMTVELGVASVANGLEIKFGNATTMVDLGRFQTVDGTSGALVEPANIHVWNSSADTYITPNSVKTNYLYGSGGTTFIAFDGASGSSYDIVLGGSVNIGNGSSNTIRIKGKDVKWQQLTIGGTTYNVLVED